MANFKIEKGIAIPPRSGRSKYPFEEMGEGDSFLIAATDAKGLASARSSVYAAASKQKIKVATRFDEKAKGLRVWRIAG